MKDLRLIVCPLAGLTNYKHFSSGNRGKATPRPLDLRVSRFVLVHLHDGPPSVSFLSDKPPATVLKAKKRAKPHRTKK
jgi:hypothetical protein